MSRRPFALWRTLAYAALLALCASVLLGVGLYIRAILTLDAMLQP